MVIILGGIISGVFTATEAGAAACVYALFLTIVVYKEIKISELPGIIWECCVTNSVVMLLIATCSVYSWILTYENLPNMLADNFFNLIQSKWAFLLILNVFLLVVGMFVDMTPALIMLVPMLLPLAAKFDISLVHLGLIMVINLSFGLTTPPVGTALFVALKVGRMSMEKSSRRCCRCWPACAWCCCSSPTCRKSTCGCRAASGWSNRRDRRNRPRPPPHQQDANGGAASRSARAGEGARHQRPRDQRRCAGHDEEARSGFCGPVAVDHEVVDRHSADRHQSNVPGHRG